MVEETNLNIERRFFPMVQAMTYYDISFFCQGLGSNRDYNIIITNCI
jgi:hypothetical protein